MNHFFFRHRGPRAHGAMAVLIPSDNIEPDDFINELYSPFCNGLKPPAALVVNFRILWWRARGPA